MNDNKLWNNRVLPALKAMYATAENVFGYPVTWDDINKYAQPMEEGRQIPLYAFFLKNEDYDKIRQKAVKNLRSYWRWPYRSEMLYDDAEIQRMKDRIEVLKQDPTLDNNWEIQDLQRKIDYNPTNIERHQLWIKYLGEIDELDEKVVAGTMTKKEYNKEVAKIAKKYDMVKRSPDADKVMWELMDYGANSAKGTFDDVKEAYETLVIDLGSQAEQDVEKVKDSIKKLQLEKKRIERDVFAAYMFFSNKMNDNRTDKKDF